MKPFQIIYAPNEIFSQKATPVVEVDDRVREIADRMFKTLEVEEAVGLGANMVGILERIAVIDTREDGGKYVMFNPEVVEKSEDTQNFKEASISFPGIEARVVRPLKIKVKYLDYEGVEQGLEAEGFLATVIQHEIDYLDGIVYLDHLSKMKRDRLLKKMIKYQKTHTPHVHGEHCSH